MKVEIWSDVVCPWCYVGKRRFEKAVEQLDADVDVVWRSFELDPSAPREFEGPIDEALARKYRLTPAKAREMIENMSEMARQEGLEIDLDAAASGNTFDAHRLIQHARAKGLGDEMAERLFGAHFVEGRSVSDREVLVDLAADVGLDPDEVDAILKSDEYAEEVRRDELTARELGVRGVPFFLIDGAYAIPGAQLPEVFVQVFERMHLEASSRG